MKNKIIIGISVVALILAGIAFVRTTSFGVDDSVGATPGTALLIENYVPAVKYNGGTYSELPIQTTSTLTAGDLTSGDATFNGGSGAIVVTSSNTATSTISVGCIQTAPTSTATQIKMTFNTSSATSTTNGTANGFVTWNYGTCPF